MYRQVLDVNVVGPFLVSLALLPSLRKKERRTIVQVGTSAAQARAEHAVRAIALLCQRTRCTRPSLPWKPHMYERHQSLWWGRPGARMLLGLHASA